MIEFSGSTHWQVINDWKVADSRVYHVLLMTPPPQCDLFADWPICQGCVTLYADLSLKQVSLIMIYMNMFMIFQTETPILTQDY